MSHVLGLPDDIRACLFDLDGVLTQTAKVHQAAWKRTFDEFLRSRDPGAAEFTQADYNRFVDGKPREDGVRDFLASRGITLPEGADGDPADAATVRGVATRKNQLLLLEALRETDLPVVLIGGETISRHGVIRRDLEDAAKDRLGFRILAFVGVDQGEVNGGPRAGATSGDGAFEESLWRDPIGATHVSPRA